MNRDERDVTLSIVAFPDSKPRTIATTGVFC